MDDQYGGLFWTIVFVVIGLVAIGCVGFMAGTVFVILIRLLAHIGACPLGACRWPWLRTSLASGGITVVGFLAYHWLDTERMWRRWRRGE